MNTHPVYDFKYNSSRTKSSGKCFQFRQNIAKREASKENGKEDSDNITCRQLTGKDPGRSIPAGNTSKVIVQSPSREKWTYQKPRAYVEKMTKWRPPITRLEKKPFLKPSFLASLSCSPYLNEMPTITLIPYPSLPPPHLSVSLCSPPNATTVLMDDRTSSATPPAAAYAPCSRIVNDATIYEQVCQLCVGHCLSFTVHLPWQ